MSERVPIPYPENPSEFEVQAELWWNLLQLGYDARCEVCVHKLGGERRGAQMDIVIFDAQRVARLIIEVKRSGTVGGLRQVRYYGSRHGRWCIMCRGKEGIPGTLAEVEQRMDAMMGKEARQGR